MFACLKRVLLRLGCFTALGILIAVSGCATMNKDECRNANWRSIGYEDGARGYPVSQIGRHRKACADHGVRPDLESYKKGHREGLKEYCTPGKGYQLGLKGSGYSGLCRGPLEAGFLDGYRQGQKIHDMEARIKDKEQEVKKLQNDLAAVDRNISDMEAELVREGIGKNRRRLLLAEIRMAESRQQDLLWQITIREKELTALKRQRDHDVAQSPFR